MWQIGQFLLTSHKHWDFSFYHVDQELFSISLIEKKKKKLDCFWTICRRSTDVLFHLLYTDQFIRSELHVSLIDGELWCFCVSVLCPVKVKHSQWDEHLGSTSCGTHSPVCREQQPGFGAVGWRFLTEAAELTGICCGSYTYKQHISHTTPHQKNRGAPCGDGRRRKVGQMTQMKTKRFWFVDEKLEWRDSARLSLSLCSVFCFPPALTWNEPFPLSLSSGYRKQRHFWSDIYCCCFWRLQRGFGIKASFIPRRKKLLTVGSKSQIAFFRAEL